jgi:hypothetical protein
VEGIFNAPALPIQSYGMGDGNARRGEFVGQITIPLTAIADLDLAHLLAGGVLANPDRQIAHLAGPAQVASNFIAAVP